MFVPLTRLLRRLRPPRSRAEELRALRRRLADEHRRGAVSEEERQAAVRLRALREELAGSFGDVSSCASCARGLPAPAGRFDGGHCCSGDTGDVFSEVEIAALAAGGTRGRDLRGPRTEHAGCAFRGERGCTLAPVDRPNLCVRFTCRALARELFGGGTLARVEALTSEMEALLARFAAARAERLLDEEWAALTSDAPVAPGPSAPGRP